MIPVSEDIFDLLCDLNDSYADLAIAMDKWKLQLEQGFFDADNTEVLAALDKIQAILNEIKNRDGSAHA